MLCRTSNLSRTLEDKMASCSEESTTFVAHYSCGTAGNPTFLTASLKRTVDCDQAPSSPTLDPACKYVRRTATPDELQLLRCQTPVCLHDGSLTPPSTPIAATGPCSSDDSMQHVLLLDSESPTAASAGHFFALPPQSAGCSDTFDADQAPLRELLQLVRQHKQELVRNGAQPALLEHLMQAALGDTDAALTIAMSAMDLATAMCTHGSPEAADRALALAEQTLQLTVQKLAAAQVMVAAQEQLQLQLSTRAVANSCAVAAPEHSAASPCSEFDDGSSCADSNCSFN